RILVPDVHHGDPPGDADLIRRQAHALGRAHRLEQIVDEPADFVIDFRDRGRLLPQHGRAEDVERANRHAGLASTAAVRLVMLATALRVITNFASPLRIVTSSSLMCTTSPMMPLEVTMRSPRWSDASSCLCCSAWRRCGRISRK